jgi:hypothetical protein
MQTGAKIIWTESEVRNRLRRYSEDDSLYDCQAVRMSHLNTGHSGDGDGIPRKIYRLLKRAEIERAMVDAFLPEDKNSSHESIRMYHILRLIYIYELDIEGAALVLDKSQLEISWKESKAIWLVMKELNRGKGQDRRGINRAFTRQSETTRNRQKGTA